MARFDLYRLSRRSRSAPAQIALVIDVQSAHLEHLESRVVVPLRPRAAAKPVSELHPILRVEDELYVLETHAVASLPRRELGHPLANLAAYRDEIVRALDILLTGF
jgi:toxin CcdB